MAGTEKPVVAVIGAGLAGLAAAIEAANANARVVVLEKEARVGGNSAKATSGMNAAVTPAQQARGFDDKFEWFKEDVIKSGGGRADPSLVETVTSQSQEALAWLTETFGLDLSALAHGGGHRRPRTHRYPPLPDGRPVPMGFTTISALSKRVKEAGDDAIQVINGAKVVKLLRSAQGDAVVGVEYTLASDAEGAAPHRLDAGAVVLATGGFAYDRSAGSLLAEFAPHLLHLATTSGPQATGDGLHLARTAGAVLVDMDQIQIHPTGLVDPKDPSNPTKFLGPEAMRGEGGILVNGEGRRFTNELGLRASVTQAIFDEGTELAQPAAAAGDETSGKATERLPPKVAYLLMNRPAAEAFGLAVLGFYKSKGLIQEAQGVDGVAQVLKLPSSTPLRETILEYNAAAAATAAGDEGGDPFGKTIFPVRDIDPEGQFYIAIVTPAIHYTMGGAIIDSGTHVLAPADNGAAAAAATASGTGTAADVAAAGGLKPIEGLYAAGEVTGGVHGANRLVGNSLLECVVMGRIAGKAAAEKATSRAAGSGSVCAAGGA